MADEKPSPKRQDRELEDLRRLAVKVFIWLSVLLVVVDVLGRLFRDPAFHVDAVVFGLVFGTLLALLGLEATNKLLSGGK